MSEEERADLSPEAWVRLSRLTAVEEERDRLAEALRELQTEDDPKHRRRIIDDALFQHTDPEGGSDE